MKGALKILTSTKMKTAIVAGAGVLLAAGTATVVIDVTYAGAQKGRLADGFVLVLNKVSFGDKHGNWSMAAKRSTWIGRGMNSCWWSLASPAKMLPRAGQAGLLPAVPLRHSR